MALEECHDRDRIVILVGFPFHLDFEALHALRVQHAPVAIEHHQVGVAARLGPARQQRGILVFRGKALPRRHP